MRNGLLIVLSGPSGVGKGAIYTKLLELLPDLAVSVSVTTRLPRTGEQEGVHYFFRSREQFNSMLENGELLEWAETFHNCYGTPRKPVISWLEKGKDVLLEIDVKGAVQIKKSYPDCITVFVLPPNDEELARRLRDRGTESDEQLAVRLHTAKEELASAKDFDYSVVNADLDTAVKKVMQIILENRQFKE